MKQFLMIASFGALLLHTSCKTEHKAGEAKDQYLVTSPLRKDTMITKNYVSQIHAIQHIEIRALERGYLQEIYVDEGQSVKKGQRMFQIMPLLYQAEVQKAQAETDFAKIEFQNTKALADSNIVSENELAMAKAKYDKAKAMLSLAQVHLGFAKIDAPFNGIMDRFQVRQGSLLDEGDLLTTLSDNSKMWVYFNVPEAEYLDLQANQQEGKDMQVSLIMANNKPFDYMGIVETIEADFNNETGNIAFRATFPNPKSLLRHGETGNVIVKLPIENALLIPQKTTFEVLDKKYVYVVDAENILRIREVKIELEMSDLYVIKSGLEETDKILLEGIRKVEEGEQIEFEFEDPAEVISHLKIHAE